MLTASLLAGCAVALLTGYYRRLAWKHGWTDTPNQRSSHLHTTPRGAGIIFVIVISVVLAWATLYGLVRPEFCGSLLAGLGVAAVGWFDDIRGLSARRRFILYWLFTVLALAFFYVVQVGRDGAIGVWPLLLLLLLVSLALQWLINLYNFMDGINGIAAVEAIFVLTAVFWLSGDAAAGLRWVLAPAIVAIGGFLLWNFPAGRVFMGDAGSAWLGFFLGTIMLWCAVSGGPAPMVWLILLGVFVVDATYTLLVRMASGQAWYAPHRLHAYQLLARRLGTHGRVVALLLSINVLWLLPWAWVVSEGWLAGHFALMFSYFPLVLACRWLGAGNVRNSRV